MTRKQLHSLLTAGIFSAALLNGIAYADVIASSSTAKSTKTSKKPTKKKDPKHTAKTDKDAAEQGCTKANGCGGH